MFSILAVAQTPAIAFTLDPALVVQMLLAFIMPVVVALVSTRVTASNVRSWLLAGLTVVTSLLTELARSIATDTTFDVGLALLAALPAFVVSVSTYYGLWKPTGVADAAQGVEATKLVK